MSNTDPKALFTLWPTFVSIYEYKDFWLDKSKIQQCIELEEQSQEHDIDSGVAVDIKRNLKESKFDFLTKKDQYPVLEKLNQFFVDSIWHCVSQGIPSVNPNYTIDPNLNPEVIIGESWYHKTNNNGYHGPHYHVGWSWGGIFYVNSKECDADNGLNRFYNPIANLGIGDIGSAYNMSPSVFDLPATEGTLVLFPAWLLHEAKPYNGDEDRTVISFNSVVVDRR